MDTRETLIHLIDKHADSLRLSRRQLADEAHVNPGQVSNWLRNNGPIAAEKKGALAEIVLNRIDDLMALKPSSPEVALLGRFRPTLVDYGPRLRRIAELPEAALTGGSISRDNPLYIQRYVDMDLEDRLKRDKIRLGISGGPKTGKSSLLWTAEEFLETTRSVIRVDFSSYQPPMPSNAAAATRDLFRWIQKKCEDQMSGPTPCVFEAPSHLVSWVSNNLLPNSQGSKCVVIFDHVGCLYQEAWGRTDGADCLLVRTFQETLSFLDYYERDGHTPLQRFGIVCAFDPSEKAFQHAHKDGVSRDLSGLSVINLDYLQGRQFDKLMATHGLYEIDELLRQQILEKGGGHPFITQVLCKAATGPEGNFAAALERGREILATAIRSRWSSERIEFAVRAMAPDSTPLPINGRGVWDLIHSGVAANEIDPEGNLKFRPRVEGLPSVLC